MWVSSVYCGKFLFHRHHVPFAFYLFAFPPLYPEHLLFVPIIVSLPERSLADRIIAAVQFPFNQSSFSQLLPFVFLFNDFASLGSFASLMVLALNYPLFVISFVIHADHNYFTDFDPAAPPGRSSHVTAQPATPGPSNEAMTALITSLFPWIFLTGRVVFKLEREDRSALHEYEYILETKRQIVRECHREKRAQKVVAAKHRKPRQQEVMQQKPTEEDEEAEEI
jgi:hypothetical protein